MEHVKYFEMESLASSIRIMQESQPISFKDDIESINQGLLNNGLFPDDHSSQVPSELNRAFIMDSSEMSGIMNQSSIMQQHNETNSTVGQVRANLSNLQILSSRIE